MAGDVLGRAILSSGATLALFTIPFRGHASFLPHMARARPLPWRLRPVPITQESSMHRPCSGWPRRWLAHVLALAMLLASGSASADLIFRYAIDSNTSVILTSGGGSGTGIGDLGISGTFDLRLMDPAESISIFENIVVLTAPNSTFEFPDFLGVDILDNIGTLGLRGQENNPLGLPDNTYFAIFDKFTHELNITGVYYEPVLDGLVYEYTINTTIIPEPSTISLLASGLIALAITRLRQTGNNMR